MADLNNSHVEIRSGMHRYYQGISGQKKENFTELASGPPPVAPCSPFGFEEAFKDGNFSEKNFLSVSKFERFIFSRHP